VYSTIPLDQIDSPADELRTMVNQGRLQGLAESIREVGLLQPIGVCAIGERYVIVFGNRRFLAHRWLGLPEIACRVLTTEEAERLASATAENVSRENLNPVEEARAIRQMIDVQGKSVRAVANALGRSEGWVRSRLVLLTWPEDVVIAVARGELTPAVGAELVGVEDEAMRGVYFRAAVENGVTASQMRQWRVDWETQRAVQGGAAPFDPTAPVPVSPVIPKALCNLCKFDFPVTALTFARLCAPCATDVNRATHVQVGGGGDGGR
jgi:ParB family chromosome partitioning protein